MLLKNFQRSFQNSSNLGKAMSGDGGYYIGLSSLSLGNEACHYGGGAYGGYHVIIGGGNTAPTKDDYDLADSSIMANDKMKSLSQIVSKSLAQGVTITVQWLNNSAEAITVKEVGLCYKSNQQAYNKASNAMVARKVLDRPVTIQPGETYAFSYTIKVG